MTTACALHIEDLRNEDAEAVEQVAALMVEAFRGHTDIWPDLDTARAEVHESFAPDRFSRIARDHGGRVLGWVGGILDYDGHVCELHPLAVHPEAQRRGIGRTLVADLEAHAAAAGALTLWLGADDEDGRTSLGGTDLFPDPLAALARISNLGGHPFEFYQKCGFVLCGVLPDANGFGRPDIFMAKRIARP